MVPLGSSQWARNCTEYSSLDYNKADIEPLLYCEGGSEGLMALKIIIAIFHVDTTVSHFADTDFCAAGWTATLRMELKRKVS